MLNPLLQMWRMRVCVSEGAGTCACGSGIDWEGVSSPPRVIPVPRNLVVDAGAAEVGSPPGRAALLQIVRSSKVAGGKRLTLWPS